MWPRPPPAGNRLILSPADRVYLDVRYHPGTALGLAWAGHIGVEHSYDWDQLLPGGGGGVVGVNYSL